MYRTLKRRTGNGLIRAEELPGEPSRYELAGLPHRHNFKCDARDRVFDVPGKCPSGLTDGLPSGFRVRDNEVVLVGTCADCGPRPTSARQHVNHRSAPRATAAVDPPGRTK